MSGPLLTIGWKERVDFLDWGLRRVRAKIDTGAFSSALDVAGYELIETDTGLTARLRIRADRRHPQRLTEVTAPVVKMVGVRNTGGHLERRPLIETLVRLGPVCRRVALTVTCRAAMRYPMILGRRALRGGFVVDVSRTYLLRP